VDIGSADRGPIDLDQDIVMADFWNRDVFHPDATLGFRFDQCFHRYSLADIA
jgi:hypothetical protein